MPHFRLPALPTAAVACGATLLGWSLGGVASVDRQLQAVSPQTPREHFVVDHPHGRHGHGERREL